MAAWLENLIRAISPEAAYRREAWRQADALLRDAYDAGSGDRLNAGWRAVNDSAEMTDRYSRDNVRARARDLERNSDLMASLVGPYKRNVVGAGFNLQAKTEDSDLNDKIEAYWKEWCRKRNCDITRTQSLTQILRMAEERKRVDGGILIHKVYTGGGLIPFKLQCLEVDELAVTVIAPRDKDCRVIGGVELDQYNRARGYWIQRYDLDGLTMMPDPVYVKADDMIYIYTKKRPSQVREMSDMAASMSGIRDAHEFQTAVSVKQRIEACLSVFIKKITPSGFGRNATGSGPTKQYEGRTLTPGMIHELNAGDDIAVINPQGQGTDASMYIKTQQHILGAGQGLSYEATSRDMSQSNYSSARQGIIEDELTYLEDRELLMDALDEIYESFLISLVLSGLVSIPDFWTDKRKYFRHEWIRPPKQWIDPAKEANATKVALLSGQKTFREVSEENGQDWRERIDDMAAEIAYAKERGIDIGGMVYGIASEDDAGAAYTGT